MATCRGCKTEFNPRRKGQEYHDIGCYRNSTIRLIKCPQCGGKFKRKFSKQVCCSKKCAFAYRARKNTKGRNVKCDFPDCRKPIYRMCSRIKKYNFCCVAHRAAFAKSDKNTSMSKGWHHTPKAKERISQAGKGRKPTKENIEKLKEANRKRIWTDKQREEARQRKLGKKNTKEQNRKIKEHARYAEKNNMWKGDFASYYAMHAWVFRHKGKAKKCNEEVTGTLPCKGRFEWSNVDHEYRRILDDYSERCTRHHRIYDIVHGPTNPEEKASHFIAKAGSHRKRIITIDGIIKPNMSNL